MKLPVVAAVVAGMLALGGCTAQTGETDAPASDPTNVDVVDNFSQIEASDSVRALMPDGLDSITVVSAQNSKPTSFMSPDGDSALGMNPDLARALARVMGVDVEIVLIPFDGVIPGMQSGKYTVAVASMSPSEERLEVLDMSSYTLGGSAIVVPKGNPKDLDSQNLCGLRVAVITGSYQSITRLPTLNEEACIDASLPEIKAVNITDQSGALLALSSDRVDAVMGDAPVAGFAVKAQADKFEVVQDDSNLVSIGGVALKAGSELTPALVEAISVLHGLPEYAAIYNKWGVSNLAIPDANLGQMKSAADGVLG
jgi:polar amino acid transport system substrate-binding protein